MCVFLPKASFCAFGVFSLVWFELSLVSSSVIDCMERLVSKVSDLLCVERDVKLLSHSLIQRSAAKPSDDALSHHAVNVSDKQTALAYLLFSYRA